MTNLKWSVYRGFKIIKHALWIYYLIVLVSCWYLKILRVDEWCRYKIEVGFVKEKNEGEGKHIVV